MNARVRSGSYYLQGVSGWGPKELANVYTTEEAELVVERMRRGGFICRVEVQELRKKRAS